MKIRCLKILLTNHKLTKAPDELRAETSSLHYHTLSLVQFLQKTKLNTLRISQKEKKWRCRVENRAADFLNMV